MTLDLCWNVVRLSYVRVAHSKKRNFGLVSDPSARNQLVLTSLTSNDGFCNFNLCKLLIVLTRFQFSKKTIKGGAFAAPLFSWKEKKWNQVLITLFWYVSLCGCFLEIEDEMRVIKEIACIGFLFHILIFFSSNLYLLYIFDMDSLD